MLTLEDAYKLAGEAPLVVLRPNRGLIRLTGPQRIWFLQNTVTNDLDAMVPGRWLESCLLELKGKVLAHFRIGVLEDEVWLDVDQPGTAPLVDWFTRYKFRTQVEIEDRSQDGWTLLTPAADGVVRDGPVFERDDRRDGYGEPPSGQLAPEELLEVLRIEAGEPRFGVDYGPDTLPQEAGLTSIVSVLKGCYVGQEVMARLHFRGHVNKSVRPLAFGAPVEPGTSLERDGAIVGKVTSCVVSPSRGPIGIGMVRVEVGEGEPLSAGGVVATAGPLPAGTKVAS